MPPKSPAPAPAPTPTHSDVFIEIGTFFLILFVVGTFLSNFFGAVENSLPLNKGWRGFLPHELTLANTRPVDSLANPIGAPVIVSQDSIDVLNDAGASKIGTQKFGAHGTIIGGPVQVNGITYYDVNFVTPPSGWVDGNGIAYVDGPQSTLVKVLLFIWKIIFFFGYFLLFISVLILLLIMWLVPKLTKARKAQREKLYPAPSETQTVAPAGNPRWQRVLDHIESPNENDWRLAIIEADIMLSDLLEGMNLVGDTIGEKLKGVARGDFQTLNAAWEAHKVRNEIAHAGGDFQLTQHEALRVIELYEQVFTEFKYI